MRLIAFSLKTIKLLKFTSFLIFRITMDTFLKIKKQENFALSMEPTLNQSWTPSIDLNLTEINCNSSLQHINTGIMQEGTMVMTSKMLKFMEARLIILFAQQILLRIKMRLCWAQLKWFVFPHLVTQVDIWFFMLKISKRIFVLLETFYLWLVLESFLKEMQHRCGKVYLTFCMRLMKKQTCFTDMSIRFRIFNLQCMLSLRMNLQEKCLRMQEKF